MPCECLEKARSKISTILVGLDFYTTSPSFLESFLSVIRIGKLFECQFRKRKGIQKPKEVEQSTTFFPATNLGHRVFRPQFCRRLPVQESSPTDLLVGFSGLTSSSFPGRQLSIVRS